MTIVDKLWVLARGAESVNLSRHRSFQTNLEALTVRDLGALAK